VAIQKLLMRFAMDRVGQVGIDSQTYAGSFDIVHVSGLPVFCSDRAEMLHVVATANCYEVFVR